MEKIYSKDERDFYVTFGKFPSISELQQYLDNRMGHFKVYNDMGVGVNRGAKRKQRNSKNENH